MELVIFDRASTGKLLIEIMYLSPSQVLTPFAWNFSRKDSFIVLSKIPNILIKDKIK